MQLKLDRAARRGALMGALLASVAGGAFAQTTATQQPAAKAAAKPDCFASISNWFYASATSCPLSADGVTFYGVIDVGAAMKPTRRHSMRTPSRASAN